MEKTISKKESVRHARPKAMVGADVAKDLPSDVSVAGEADTDTDTYGTLVLDSFGRICGCSPAGELLFGAAQEQLDGVPISAFIGDLRLSENSPSYSARRLAHLCSRGGWRTASAVDVNGKAFSVDVNLVRFTESGRELFLLNLRRTGTSRWH